MSFASPQHCDLVTIDRRQATADELPVFTISLLGLVDYALPRSENHHESGDESNSLHPPVARVLHEDVDSPFGISCSHRDGKLTGNLHPAWHGLEALPP